MKLTELTKEEPLLMALIQQRLAKQEPVMLDAVSAIRTAAVKHTGKLTNIHLAPAFNKDIEKQLGPEVVMVRYIRRTPRAGYKGYTDLTLCGAAELDDKYTIYGDTREWTLTNRGNAYVVKESSDPEPLVAELANKLLHDGSEIKMDIYQTPRVDSAHGILDRVGADAERVAFMFTGQFGGNRIVLVSRDDADEILTLKKDRRGWVLTNVGM